MANKIIIKKSSVASKVPVAGDLDVAELAVNLADAKLYTKNASGTVIQLGGGSGSGDVVGPSSATDNALARFDGTTGKLIQNSTVTLDDNGNVINANSVGFDTTPATVPTTVGTMSWDDGDGVPSVLLKGGNAELQVGTQQYARVYNDNGTTITKGQVVYISGAQGNRVAVKLARADVEATSFGTIGIVAETITNGSEGFIITSGALYQINTTGLTAGATVYLSPSTAGAITTTKPQAPQQLVVVGWVERVDNIVGSVYVKIDNGYELDELHDVRITSPVSGNLLIYDATTTPIGVWKNANLTAGTGISVTNGAGSISIANTGVTSVTGTSPIVSSGGATPAISMPAATTSVNGYLTSTDWNTFNGKQAALVSGTNIKTVNGTTLLGSGNLAVGTVTSVAMTTPTGLTISGSPITSSGTLALTLTAGYSIPTTSSQTNWDTAFSERQQWNGGSTNLVASTGRTSLGGTTIGQNIFTLTNPSAITFPRFNADNTVSALDAATFRTAIGAGTGNGNGTVTSVSGTGSVSGLTLSGTVTTSGSLTLGGTLSVTPSAVSDQANSSTGWFDVPVGTTAQRGSPTTGAIRYNTTTTSFEIYNGTAWLQITASAYANPPPSLEYLIIAGGGSGGGNSADGNQRTGGGGAGGYRTATGLTFSSNTALTVTVGSGGATASGDVSYSGNSSSFSGVVSTGGGGGGNQGNGPYTGGSGGGGSSGTTTGAAGTAGQGNSGANSTGYNGNGGGGGGAGSAGSGANGGSGSASSITGTSVTYAGGGAGTNGSGGSGGGGNPSTAGSVNTGSGGGGGFASAGGAGGSGIVVIRYSNTYDQASSSYLSGTYSYANTGGNHVYTFTGSGSIGWRG